MTIKFPILLGAFLLLHCQPLSAQAEKVIYQYLLVNDSVSTIKLQLMDSIEVIPWHHENKVMIEANTQLEGGSLDLLKIVIREGRYNIIFENNFPYTTLHYVLESRPLLKNRDKLCIETVKLKIYIPDIFEMKSPNEYTRIVEPLASVKK